MDVVVVFVVVVFVDHGLLAKLEGGQSINQQPADQQRGSGAISSSCCLVSDKSEGA